jgi:hypothetical protein
LRATFDSNIIKTTPTKMDTAAYDDLPEQFQNIPLEFRLLQQKFDKQKIFTNISNEVRLDSRLRSHQYKEDHKTDLVRGKA